MSRYAANDFGSPRAIRTAQYDRLREGGIPRERAAEIAAASVDKTLRKIDAGPGLGTQAKAPPPVSTHTNRFRVPWPWEQQETSGAAALGNDSLEKT